MIGLYTFDVQWFLRCTAWCVYTIEENVINSSK